MDTLSPENITHNNTGSAQQSWGWAEEAWGISEGVLHGFWIHLQRLWHALGVTGPSTRAWVGGQIDSKDVGQSMHRSSRAESCWLQTCPPTPPTWSWAAWGLRIWLFITVWDTQCEHPHPEGVRNPEGLLGERGEKCWLSWLLVTKSPESERIDNALVGHIFWRKFSR